MPLIEVVSKSRYVAELRELGRHRPAHRGLVQVELRQLGELRELAGTVPLIEVGKASWLLVSCTRPAGTVPLIEVAPKASVVSWVSCASSVGTVPLIEVA